MSRNTWLTKFIYSNAELKKFIEILHFNESILIEARIIRAKYSSGEDVGIFWSLTILYIYYPGEAVSLFNIVNYILV
jgi:hypothetical protein